MNMHGFKAGLDPVVKKMLICQNYIFLQKKVKEIFIFIVVLIGNIFCKICSAFNAVFNESFKSPTWHISQM